MLLYRAFQLLAVAATFSNPVHEIPASPPCFAGALLAPLGLRDPLSAGSLPPVTMVFCSIEGGKQYASLRSKADARDVHMELIAVMRGALKQVPGGYFVRHQDGEFKYLVVFAHPEVGGWVVGWLRLTDCDGGWNFTGQERCIQHVA